MNSINIDTFERVDFKSRETEYCIHIYDDNDETVLIVTKEEIDCSDITVLENVIKAKNHPEIHGGSCQTIEEILDFVSENAKSMTIANELYSYEQLEETLSQDIRTVCSCPICGWELFGEDCYELECGQSNCNGFLTLKREEWFDK